MPSLGTTIWEGGKTIFSALTGSQKEEKKEERAHDSNNPAEDNDSDVEEVQSATGSKRRREVKRVEVPRKRQDTRSEHEKRLIANYGNPSDAIPISFPGSFDGAVEEDKRTESTMSRKPGAGHGMFRPKNTLNAPSYGQIKRAGGVGSQYDIGGERAYSQTTGVGKVGNGFRRSEQEGPAAKKRKTGTNARTDLPNDPIEVEDDGDVHLVRKVNGKPVQASGRNARTQQMLTSPPHRPFEGNEFGKVDNLTKPEHKKPRRKPANGTHSSQASSRGSPAHVTNGISGHRTSGSNEVILVDDDTSQEISESQLYRPPTSSGEELPDVKGIANGLDAVGQERLRRLSQTSADPSHAAKSTMPPSNGNNRQARPAQQQANQSKRREIRRDDDPTDLTEQYTRGKARRSQERRLSGTFVRDDPVQPAKEQISQRSRMKAESGQASANMSATRDSLGSADELTGPTTVRSVSPEKRQRQDAESRRRANGSRESRSPSASNLRHTQFIQSHSAHKPRSKSSARDRQNDLEPIDERENIQLKSFCAVSCFLTEDDGKITLHYDSRDSTLDVYCNDELQVIRNCHRFVSISSKEAKDVFYCNGSPFVYLKGVRDDRGVSNGRICFRLQDAEDVPWLTDRLIVITKYAINLKCETEEKMLQTFTKQARELCALNKKQQTSGDVGDTASLRNATARNDIGNHDWIQYETEDLQRPSRRKGMQADEQAMNEARPGQASHGGEQSPYFYPPRRTTRKSNLVKRSPSPPLIQKWTEVNKPKRWPHSVTYPPVGPRQATVDFQNLENLDEGEFLNDNLIYFALRRIEESMAPEHKEGVHFFNTFFYNRLTAKDDGKKGFNYEAVKRWTKGKDLLGCDYVVVPINFDLHWFVAIICNLPNLSRKAAGLEEEEQDEIKDEPAATQSDVPVSSDAIEPPSAANAEQDAVGASDNTKGMRHLSLSDNEESTKLSASNGRDVAANEPPGHEANDAELPTSARKPAGPTGRKGKKRGPPSFHPDNPSIITLDSFGTAHTGEIRALKEYIKAEAEEKRGMEVDLGQLQGANIKGIPTQTNFSDCGVYLVGYLEQFAKNPREFVTKALGRTLGDEGEFKGFDPSQKRNEIRAELLKLQKEQEEDRKAKKASKKAAVKTDTQAPASTAASPKPESKPASKAASPANEPVKQAATQRQRVTPSWTPVDTADSNAEWDESKDKDLEYEVPRALRAHSPRPANDPQTTQQEDPSLEMLDDPNPGKDNNQKDASKNSDLLENVESDLRRQSEQIERMEPLRNAAVAAEAQKPAEGGDTHQGDDSAGEDARSGVGADEVIDLGDEDAETRQPVEIPDSQEQQARQRRRSRSGTSIR